MKYLVSTMLSLLLGSSAYVHAQQAADQGDQPFEAGQPLGVVINGEHTPMSDNVKVYGAIVNAESCVYDESRDLIVAVNRGADQDEAPNDGFISLINHDGSVHTARWIGVNRNGLVLNHPFGSDIHDGKLYVADRDGGTDENTPTVSVIRMFDMETGAPAGEIKTEGSPGFNDIEVAEDGTIYATQTSAGGQNPDPSTFRVFKITPDGASTVLIEGDPLNLPNGIAIDGEGNLVVVNIGSKDVLTFSPEGELLKTEQSAQAGNDGIVIMEDGTKYVSSVREGGIARIAPDGTTELIATAIPSAASMCYDAGANQLVVPMNTNNALALIPLEN